MLQWWARRPTSAQALALALRCRVVLAAADGQSSKEIAARLGRTRSTVGRWRGRFAERGLDGLHDEPRPGKPRSSGDEDVERVIETVRSSVCGVVAASRRERGAEKLVEGP